MQSAPPNFGLIRIRGAAFSHFARPTHLSVAQPLTASQQRGRLGHTLHRTQGHADWPARLRCARAVLCSSCGTGSRAGSRQMRSDVRWPTRGARLQDSTCSGACATLSCCSGSMPRRLKIATSSQQRLRPPSRRKLTVEYNPHKAVDSAAAAGITWLDLERIEERYLLAACADGALCCHAHNPHRFQITIASSLAWLLMPRC